MKLTPARTVAELAAFLGADFDGDPNHLVSGINEIHRVVPGDLTFVDIPKYFQKALQSAATTILLNRRIEVPPGKALIYSDDPFRDFNRLTEHYDPRLPFVYDEPPVLGAGTVVGKNVVFGRNVALGRNVVVGHNVSIGNNVRIGDDTVLFPNVVVYDNVIIGRSVCIQSGAIIGGEAFYFKKREHGRDKMFTHGRVVIGDYVEIGANTTIDRGVSADTVIGDHTKIDNLVQIGHDTVIGKRCLIAAQVGIAGATDIHDDVTIWGQAGVPSDIRIGPG
ncbi:MAG: UDP-3-O-(3-hydroxymyristoyl)glucosamine N-acyltransferase, partial [Bacteroidia bacterium]|nr:UDP-3-O-(3-hydroxymyristoyl)glucosamine N-acyltransferase [Bacteroidia bacterium]